MDSFYIPMHAPSDKEVREIIEEEGSFKINKMLVHEPNLDESSISPKMLALMARAVFEPMMVQHFGKSDQIMEELVNTTERHVSMKSPQIHAASFVFLCVSVTKKM